MGCPCYPDIASIPEPVDCLVSAVPNRHVPDLLESAANAGVRAAVVFSAGFGEIGGEGKVRQARLEALSQRARLFDLRTELLRRAQRARQSTALRLDDSAGISRRFGGVGFAERRAEHDHRQRADAQPPCGSQPYYFLRQSVRRDDRRVHELLHRRRQTPALSLSLSKGSNSRNVS